MGEEYNQRISNIASGLVKFEKEFNKKIINETSVIESIKSITKKYNEQGQDLILESLEKQAELAPSELLKSTGEISETVLTEAISYAVNTASNKGIDIIAPQQSNNEKNTINRVAEGVLTLVAIDIMVNNFDNLTTEQRGLLRENYEHLTSEQRSKYDKGMLDKIKNSKLDDKTKKDLTDFFEGDFHSSINTILNILQKNHGIENFNLSKISQSEILKIIENLDIPKELKDKLKKYDFGKLLSIDKSEQKLADWYLQRESAIKSGNLEEVKRLDELIGQYKSSPEHQSYLKSKETSEKNEEQIEEATERNSSQNDELLKTTAQDASQIADSEASDKSAEDIDIPQTISQEIEQLPVILGKANFSQEEIKEALKMYTTMIKSIPITIYENKTSAQIIKIFQDCFDEPPESNADKILVNILSQNDFNGNLQQILTNPEMRENFLQQLEQLTQPTQEQQPIQDEHTTEYYSSQNETLQVDETAEKIAREVQARGGSSYDITKALVREVEEHATGQTQQAIQEEQPKVAKAEQTAPPISESPAVPEEHIQESVPLPEQESHQNTALVKPDNSFIGKVRRVFANMKDMKNKDNSKGFFSRLGASFKTVFGNKEEYFEGQDDIAGVATTEITTEPKQPLSFDEQLQQGIDLSKINQVAQLASQQNGQVLTQKGTKVLEDRDDDDFVQ